MVNGQPVAALQNISCFLRLNQPKALSWCVCSQRFRICIKSPKYCTLTVLKKVQLPSCLSLSDVHVVIIVTKHWIDWDVFALYAFISIPQWMNRVFSKNLSAFMVTDIPKGIFHSSRLFLDKVCKFVHSWNRKERHIMFGVRYLWKVGPLRGSLVRCHVLATLVRGYHYGAGLTPCQQAQPPMWFF